MGDQMLLDVFIQFQAAKSTSWVLMDVLNFIFVKWTSHDSSDLGYVLSWYGTNRFPPSKTQATASTGYFITTGKRL
jgi:hypothetical protein